MRIGRHCPTRSLILLNSASNSSSVSLVISSTFQNNTYRNLKDRVSRQSVHRRHDEPLRKLQITGRRPAIAHEPRRTRRPDSRCASPFDCSPPGIRDPDAKDFDWLGVSFHGLPFRSRKPGADEASDHVAIEPMGAQAVPR